MAFKTGQYRDWPALDARLAELIRSGKVANSTQASKALRISNGTLQAHIRTDWGLNLSELAEKFPLAYGARQVAAAMDLGADLAAALEDNGLRLVDAQAEDEAEAKAARVEHQPDRSIILEKLMAITEEDQKSPERVMILLGFDPELWKFRSLKMTLWTGQRGQLLGGGAEPLHSVKAHIEPKTVAGTPVADLLATITKRLNAETVPLPRPPARKVLKSSRVLEFPQTDWHLGNDAFEGDYDAEAVIRAGHADLLGQATAGAPIGRIVLPVLSDIFHYDTKSRTTTGGTPMGTSLRPHEMVDLGVRLMADLIRDCLEIAPVEVVQVAGNHDYMLTLMLMVAMEQRYTNNKHLTIDRSEAMRKWRLLGVNLVAWMHGELPKSRAKNWLPVEASEAWSRAQYAEIHAGHWHTRQMDEAGGVIAQYLPSPAPTDGWHHEKGFVGASRGFMSFLWELDQPGWREQRFSPVLATKREEVTGM